jgi:hypothetical protein
METRAGMAVLNVEQRASPRILGRIPSTVPMKTPTLPPRVIAGRKRMESRAPKFKVEDNDHQKTLHVLSMEHA